jgi:hypothetical protein
MTKRITKIVQSMFHLLSGYKPIASNLLSAQCLSPFFLVNLLFGFHIGIDRVAAMTAHDFLSPLHHPFGTLAQLSRLPIQSVKTLSTSLTKIFPRFFAPEQRSHQPTDGR